MQGLRLGPNDVVSLDLSTPNMANSSSSSSSASLSIDGSESIETRIHRLISEHPVIIFSRSSCCMCHAMKKLLAAVGVQPTVIELDDHEISALPPPPPPPPSPHPSTQDGDTPRSLAPALFIGGTCVGGLDSLFGLHISGLLVPKLIEVGALWV